ncbi:ATP-dependent 6-phosphofructokinase subunit alpha [[Candida] jaroonii]|uniref:ATP-dependent 6-phosphofructokinase subunit alpha n=1 Tax=[Candida] jaroonii TaxID=467808 RepID=A0ACA9YDQ7_9ASCO|nr:ATP-dependent 6-phosphofructokinase subunit alpha [[Candida] jaroonii]
MSKISCISLVTNDEVKFEETAKFYNSIGFRSVRYYNKNNHQVQFETLGISNDSVQEVWLESFPLQDLDSTGDLVPLQELDIYKGDNCEHYNDAILIKLRLVTVEVIDNAKDLEFFTCDLNNCEKLFKTFEDPLGNRVTLTDKYHGKQFKSIEEFISYKKSILAPPKDEKPTLHSKKKKIAVMTSGGDSPGMNPAVRAVVRASIYYGCDAFAIYEGYEGLVNDYIKKMEWEDVRSFLSYGGTNIGTARSKKFRTPEGRLIAAKNMVKNGIDALIVCGGDGSLTGADLFRAEWPSLVERLVSNGDFTEKEIEPYKHLTIVGLVGSIDNDMSSTDATIGAYSALERITEMVDYIDATATSHSRAFVVEVMGRHCGWLGLMSGMSTGADFIFIPERPPKAGKWQEELKTVVKRHRSYGKRNSTVIVAEGAIDDELNPITSEDVRSVLVELGLDTRITTLGHVQRGGTAVAYDRMLGTMQGVEAVKAVLESTKDTESPMIGIVGNKIVRQPLMKAVELTKQVATSIEAKDFDGAMKLRDSNFADGYKQYLHTSNYDDGSMVLPAEKQLNIGIIHIGASSSGLNASTRAITLYCLSKGHKVFGIQNGFHGLIKNGSDSIKELHWIDVANWYNKGGSEIGTNRSLPSENFGKVAFYLQQQKLDGLIIIGGFESFTAVHQLDSEKNNYPIFNIPMIVIPATVSNNVPGSEYSLGCDTCLNQLVNYCDAVKQSASSTRRRVFIVEVQGGHSGFVASFTGLVTGSIATYTPEKTINLKTIQEDLSLIFEIFANDRGEDKNGKIIIRNELSSKIYDTELISDILKENGKKRFETRTAIPGHVQQGFTPSSMDRMHAINFGIKSMEFIEDIYGVNGPKAENVDNHVVIGLIGSKIEYNSISELYKDANIELRKSNTIHWEKMNKVGDILSGRLRIRESKQM